MGFSGFRGSTSTKMNEMAEAGENLEMWWPLWAMNFIQLGYDNYSRPDATDRPRDQRSRNSIRGETPCGRRTASISWSTTRPSLQVDMNRERSAEWLGRRLEIFRQDPQQVSRSRTG
jgi:hypothetical protein